jgi:hypothetical protein
MDAEGFLAALAPAVTDAQARERFLADPKAVLVAAGLDLPEWFTVSAREGDVPELTITVPALLDPDADLNEEQLEGAAGGLERSKLCNAAALRWYDTNEFFSW